MRDNHAWANGAHNGTDFFPHVRFVAVHPAVPTGGFAFLEGTVAESFAGIRQQLPALGTEFVIAITFLLPGMVFSAILANHHGHGFFFSRHARMTIIHLVLLSIQFAGIFYLITIEIALMHLKNHGILLLPAGNVRTGCFVTQG